MNNTTPGYSVLVTKNDKIIFQENVGLADIYNTIPITSNTAFRLASLTKPFTAMAIMILYERKMLRFDDPVFKFFPDFPSYGKNITIRQLLTHTSGLPDHERPLYKEIDKYKEPTMYDSLDILKKEKTLLFKSGEKYQYSDAGFVMLALIIEKTSGQKYSWFLKKNIFDPLKLTNTLVVDESKPVIKNRAFGYKKINDKYELYDYDPLNYIIGDEGIYSTVMDLALWRTAWKYPILVKETTLNKALQLMNLNDGTKGRCGFSWFIQNINEKKYIFHDGTWVGFNNIVLTDCERNTTVILLSNSTTFSTEKKRINAALKVFKKVYELP